MTVINQRSAELQTIVKWNRDKLHGNLVEMVQTATRSSKVEMDTSIQTPKQHIYQVVASSNTTIATKLKAKTEHIRQIESVLNITLNDLPG